MNEKKTLLVQYIKNRKINGDVLTDFFIHGDVLTNFLNHGDVLTNLWGRFDQFGDVLTRGRFD